jgi:hypothetical protein
VADDPTSGYEKLESFCFAMKRRISSSVGAVSLNNVTLLPISEFVDGWKLVTICTDKAANQFGDW